MPAQAFTPPAKQKMGTSGRLCITSQAGENMKWLTRDLAKEFLLRCSPPLNTIKLQNLQQPRNSG